MLENPIDSAVTERLRAGRISSVQLVDDALRRLDRTGPAAANARALALRADDLLANGSPPPACGMPIVLSPTLPGISRWRAAATAGGAIVLEPPAGADPATLVATGAVPAALTHWQPALDVHLVRHAHGPALAACHPLDFGPLWSLLTVDGPLPEPQGLPGVPIGAYSDSIGDRDARAAVAEVATLLSLSGNMIRDLDAETGGLLRRPRRWRGRIAEPGGIRIDTAGGTRPGRAHLDAHLELSLTAGHRGDGTPRRIRFLADHRHAAAVPALASLVHADRIATEQAA